MICYFFRICNFSYSDLFYDLFFLFCPYIGIMKKLLLCLLVAATASMVHAQEQEYDTIPPYQKDSLHLPRFTILKTDSTYMNDRSIPEGKPVVIVYFTPTCGHCQITAEAFSKKMKEMRHIYFVWVSYSALPEVKEFAANFSLQQFNNLVIGRDPNYAIPSFYKVNYTPYMALYNAQHHLVQTWEKGTEPDTIISLLKNNK